MIIMQISMALETAVLC